MQTKYLTCICCPLGCSLTAQMENGSVISVTGNGCKNGDRYARQELTNPTRTVTTTVRVVGGSHRAVSVKTAEPVPKSQVLDVVRCLKPVEIPAPVTIGQMIVHDAAGTGIDIIATKSVSRE